MTESDAVATTTIVSGDAVPSSGGSSSSSSTPASNGSNSNQYISVGSGKLIPRLTSAVGTLSLDINGDGTIDATSSPNTAQNTDQILQMLEKSCDALDHNGSRGKGFINRLEHARSVWKSWQTKKTASSHQIDFEGIGGSIGHLKLKGLNASDKERVWNGIDAFVKQFE